MANLLGQNSDCDSPAGNSGNVDRISSGETATFMEKGRVLDDGLGSRWCFWRRRRYIVVMMLFFGDATKGMLRSNMSVAVFPMTENHTYVDENGTTTYVQDFDWDAKTRGFLLSSFFYGFVVTHIPGGILAVKYGGSKLYGLGVGLTSFTTMLTPLAARVHFYALIALRILEGMCEGILAPSLEILSSRWIPIEERSFLVGMSSTGIPWGDVASTAASSALGHHLGWQAIFYFSGGFGILCYVCWLLTVKEFPAQDKKISSSEFAFIDCSLGKIRQRKRKISDIPYLKIITSRPVLAIILANAALSWSYATFLTQLPAYIKDVLHFGAENSGYISSLTFSAKLLAIYFFSPLADFLIRKKILTTTFARKLFMCGFLTIMALFSFLIQHATSVSMAVGCMVVIYACVGIGIAQVIVNTIDVAAEYSSVVSGAYLTVFALCGIISPYLTGYLTQNKTVEEWHTVFSIHGGICLLSAVSYGILASGELQDWATKRDEAIHKVDVHNRHS